MQTWGLLAMAIALEVAGTLALRAAADHWGWIIAVVVGYTAALGLLGVVLRRGVPIGVTYSIWSGVGVALTAVFGWVLFDEALTLLDAAGLLCIVGGVALVQSTPKREYATCT